MVPVAANHATHVVDGDPLPGFGTDVLPARNLLKDKEPNLVAAVQEVARLRIVRGADNVAVKPLAQNIRVFTLHASGHGLADKGKRLVTIQTTELDDLTVQ